MWSAEKFGVGINSERIDRLPLSCHSQQHLNHWEALSALKKRALINLCCHCWSSVIRSNFNTLFSLIDFSLPQIVLNEISFIFFSLSLSSISGNYPAMSTWCRGVLDGVVFVKTRVWGSLTAARYGKHACVHNHMWSRHMPARSEAVAHLP